MIIDAHQHLWQIGQNGHEWPTPELDSIYSDFVADDLLTASKGLDITGTVLVQSQPCDADTAWMLDIAATTPLIRAVVGWADLAAPDAPQRLTRLAQKSKLKGLRPMLQSLPEDDWILHSEIQPALAAMTEHGLSFDALVFTRHLVSIDWLAKKYPSLSIIINHGGKPPLANPNEMPRWQSQIAAIAQNANVTCKFSGLVTEMANEQIKDILAPCADHLLAVFGADRLMWGSDWPVVLLKTGYSDWLDWTSHWLDGKPESTRTKIMGETARRIYRI